MKKILIIALILVLCVLGAFAMKSGIPVFGVEGIQGLQEKNTELDQKIEEAKTLTSSTFPSAQTSLESEAKKLMVAKENYDDLVAFNGTEETPATQYERYEIEFLWAKIGNHATKQGVVLKMDVTNPSSGTPNVYDLKFTVTGSYIGITDFIYAIEDDSQLGFRIENFKMLPSGATTTSNSSSNTNQTNSTTAATATATSGGNTSTLQATFSVKDVAINIENAASTNAGTTNNEQATDTTTNANNTGDNTTVNTTNNTANTTNANVAATR